MHFLSWLTHEHAAIKAAAGASRVALLEGTVHAQLQTILAVPLTVYLQNTGQEATAILANLLFSLQLLEGLVPFFKSIQNDDQALRMQEEYQVTLLQSICSFSDPSLRSASGSLNPKSSHPPTLP